MIEAVFDGPAPDPAALGPRNVTRSGSRLAITDPDPEFAIGRVLNALDTADAGGSARSTSSAPAWRPRSWR